MPDTTDRLYTIGQTAAILNLSVPTLRHYDKLGLIKPAHINAKTGYRYYTEAQLHYIDRIKYLQDFGFHLTEIRAILQDGRSERLLPRLRQKQADYDRQIADMRRKKRLLQWYVQYFSYGQDIRDGESLYEQTLPRRYAVWAAHEGENPPVTSDIKLLQAKNTPALKHLYYKKQWGCVLDYERMTQKAFILHRSFVLLAEKPAFASDYVCTLPAGRYLCFKARLLEEDFTRIGEAETYFSDPRLKPGVVLALEYENNFHEYVSSLYEIQIEILSASPQESGVNG
jgi:DNA-binding transcriptional MerR regulator